MNGPRRSHPTGASYAFPVLLILSGLILLLNTLDVLSWSVWNHLLPLWPMLLIAWGVELLLRRQPVLGNLLSALIIIAAFAIGLWLHVNDPAADEWRHVPFDVPLADAERATITLTTGVNRLTLSALPADDRAALLRGTADQRIDVPIEQSFTEDGGHVHVTLRERLQGRAWFGIGGRFSPAPRWSLQLQRNLPLVLNVETGVGDVVLDLSELHVERLQLKSGVGATRVILPAEQPLVGEIRAGIGQTVIQIPAEAAARIVTDTGIGSVTARGYDEKADDAYYYGDWLNAERRSELRVSGGIGEIVIEPRPSPRI